VTAEFSATLQREMGAELKVPVTVVTGKNDYEQNAARCGNFNGWCRSITRRKDWATNEQFYRLIVLPKTEGIGKATMMIVEDALKAGIPVLETEFADEGITVRTVTRIECEDPDNFISGWRPITIDT
jgi:hypothetical protein